MTTHPLTVVPLDNGAQFIFTPCPGTKDSDLTSSVQTIREAGADAVITTLSDQEIEQLQVSGLGEEISRAGMHWFQLPIEDDESPDELFLEQFSEVKSMLSSLIDDKATIAIHCRGGSGRTGLMAAILLLEKGLDWSAIKTRIQAARPKSLTLEPHTNFLKTHYGIEA